MVKPELGDSNGLGINRRLIGYMKLTWIHQRNRCHPSQVLGLLSSRGIRNALPAFVSKVELHLHFFDSVHAQA